MSPVPIEVTFTDALVNAKSIYRTGQVLPLVVKVRLSQPINCTIYAKIYGECSVSWLDGFITNTDYKATEVHLNHQITVFSSENPHPPGQQSYPINFTLPAATPSSFFGDHGFIRYFVTACIDQRPRLAHCVQKPFTVIRTVDLNDLPIELVGQYSIEEALAVKCCFCCGCCCGCVRLRLLLPRRGFMPGDLVEISGEIRNESSADFEDVCLQICQQSTFFVNTKCKYVSKTAASIELPPVRKGQSLQLRHKLPIVKTLPTYFLDCCQNIKVHHFLQLIGNAGCSWSLKKQLCEIIVGTAPVK